MNLSKQRWFVFAVNNPYIFYFRLLIILLAVYNAIALPMQVAFIEVQTLYDNAELKALETSVDIIFLVDIIVNFLQAYVDVFLGEIYQPKMIA